MKLSRRQPKPPDPEPSARACTGAGAGKEEVVPYAVDGIAINITLILKFLRVSQRPFEAHSRDHIDLFAKWSDHRRRHR
jgi:hypothetical protein